MCEEMMFVLLADDLSSKSDDSVLHAYNIDRGIQKRGIPHLVHMVQVHCQLIKTIVAN